MMLSVLLLAAACGVAAGSNAFDLQSRNFQDDFCTENMKFRRHETDCKRAYICYTGRSYEVKCKDGKYFKDDSNDMTMTWAESDKYCVSENTCDFTVNVETFGSGFGSVGLKCSAQAADASQGLSFNFKWTKDDVTVRNADDTNNDESILSSDKVNTGSYKCEADNNFVTKSQQLFYTAPLPPPTSTIDNFGQVGFSFRPNADIPAGWDPLLARDYGRDSDGGVSLNNKMNIIVNEMDGYRNFLENAREYLAMTEVAATGAKSMFDSMIAQWDEKTLQWKNYMVNRGAPVIADKQDFAILCSAILDDGKAKDAYRTADFNLNKAMCACKHMTQAAFQKSSGCDEPIKRGLQHAVEDAVAWELDMLNGIKDDILASDDPDYQTRAFLEADLPIRQQMINDLKVFSNRLQAAETDPEYLSVAPAVDLKMKPLTMVKATKPDDN